MIGLRRTHIMRIILFILVALVAALLLFIPRGAAAAEGRLSEMQVNWADDHAMCVVMAAKGYPGAYAKGTEIRGGTGRWLRCCPLHHPI